MKISDFSFSEYKANIRQGIRIQIGPFVFKITLKEKSSIVDFYNIYQHYEILENPCFIDFDITIKSPKSFRRWLYPQVNFYLGNHRPFKPLPANQAYAMLEWGMNWCIANHAHHYFILHAAVVEKNGVAIILPAESGSGKSTLSAALVYDGWRLFSDELALISLKDGQLHPTTRPINLKNDSISIIKKRCPEVYHSNVAFDTHKGTVSLFQPPKESVDKIGIKAMPNYVIFPKYQENSLMEFTQIPQEKAAFKIIENSFNYNVLGGEGFLALMRLSERAQAYSFQYSNTDEAINHFNHLSEGGS